jgi:hypothetical protein
MNRSSMLIPVTLEGLNNLQGCSVTGLIDSSATGRFINESVVEERGMEREALPIPVPVYNADGTLNKGGLITHVVHLRLAVQDHTEVFPLAITDTGKSDMIIGYNWLRKHNPEINWEKGELKFSWCPPACKHARLQEEWARKTKKRFKRRPGIYNLDLLGIRATVTRLGPHPGHGQRGHQAGGRRERSQGGADLGGQCARTLLAGFPQSV